MSTAWYKSRMPPKLLQQWISETKNNSKIAVEIWNTTCIVTNFGKSTYQTNDETEESNSHCHHILINPANPQLSGVSQFPYFPRGGPVPKKYPNKDAHHIMGYVTQWGGMDVGDGMLFSSNVVDGLVHQLGGSSLALECQQIGQSSTDSRTNKSSLFQSFASMARKWIATEDKSHLDTVIRCPEGQAVITGPGDKDSELARHYDQIIHTVPPFYKYSGAIKLSDDNGIKNVDDKVGGSRSSGNNIDPVWILRQCYGNSLNTVATSAHNLYEPSHSLHLPGQSEYLVRVACPLIGAGCRGFPLEVAISVAANSASKWLHHGHSDKTISSLQITTTNMTLAFGIPDPTTANLLAEALEKEI